MKKILCHINSLGKGGAERVMSNLINMFVEDDIEIVLATEWFAEDEYSISDKVRRIHVGLTEEEQSNSRIQKLVCRFTDLRKCIQEEKPDIVLAFSKNANYRAILASLGTGIPVVVSERSDPNFQYKGIMARIKGESIYRLAAGNVFQTEYARDFFSKAIQRKSTVIMNPLNSKYLSCEQSKTRSKNIVTVGRLSKVKNQKMMVEAMNRIKEEYPDYVLKIYGADIGEGTEDELKSLISKFELQEKVHLMGNSDTLEEDILDAAVFLLTSDYEGMPNSLMEAMAMGIPCIATDCPCGGSRYLLTTNDSGLLVPMNDADALADKIRFVLQNYIKMQEMGARAQYVKEQMNPQRIYEQWKQYLERQIKGNK